ncbi:hypothetical protein SAMN04487911_11115 [Arenibacter nanhaiticus]|uniref:Uncharacterized protein n=1 Tax=Arenibacter nanhaiticus TaxID=558155 RepID=A0A1M6GHC0_9FLAO|nr:hypothetical protein SAMN04487911_11115 [Arenibacter nanhaiticus]
MKKTSDAMLPDGEKLIKKIGLQHRRLGVRLAFTFSTINSVFIQN